MSQGVSFEFHAAHWIAGAARFASDYEGNLVPRLNAVTEENLLPATQALVHVVTGSLRDSGKAVPFDLFGDEFIGGLEYGGASGGPNNPVTYADLELSRGGSHDFLTGPVANALPLYEEQYGDAFEVVIDGWN